MHWRYDWVDALPAPVYTVLVEMLNREHAAEEELVASGDYR